MTKWSTLRGRMSRVRYLVTSVNEKRAEDL